MRARAWCRVDLAGGTLDIWPIGLPHRDACTVALAITVGVEVVVASRDRGYRVVQGQTSSEVADVSHFESRADTALIGLVARHFALPPVEITVRSDSPRGGGLGASSALAVAMIAASEVVVGSSAGSPEQRSALARDLEARLMRLPTGRQDHFAALLGGALCLEQRPGGERVRRLDVDLAAVEGSLLVAHTGDGHFSAGNNWRVIRRRLDGDKEVVERFDGIAGTAAELARALEEGDFSSVGRLMSREWELRRGLAAGISTPRIEELLAAAQQAGAWGGKACGAGGGGCVALLTPPGRRQAVVAELEARAARLIAARPCSEPLLLSVSHAGEL